MKKSVFFLFLFLAVAGVRTAEACSCSPSIGRTLKQQVRDASSDAAAIFVGKLVKLEEPRGSDGELTGEVIAQFEVERTWKGTVTETIVVYTTNRCCICGFPFVEGARYIVYSHGTGRLAVSMCSRTRQLDSAISPDEIYLGKPKYIERKRISLGSSEQQFR